MPVLGQQNTSVLEDEDVASAIELHLQSKGKYACAEDVVKLLDNVDVRRTLGLKRPITIRTARRWLRKMGYKWKKEPKGLYFDGHERADVVDYRTHKFLPAWHSIEPYMLSWDE